MRVVVAYSSAHFLSFLGNGILAVALPLIVLQATGSPLSMGAVSTATAVPALLVGLCAGVLIDRVNRRTCATLADVVSAVTVAAIPVVEMLWGLNLAWLVVLAILGSCGDVPGMTARQVMLPAVARHAGVSLERLVSVRQTLTSTALVVGPGAAGTLLSLFDSSTVLFVTAGTSAAAALITATLPRGLGAPDATRRHRGSLWTQLTAGAVELRRSRFLTGTVSLTLGMAVALGGLQGMVLPLYFSVTGRPDLLGFVLTALAAGMLLGTGMFTLAGPRVPRRLWMAGALLGTTTGFLLMATLAGPTVVFAGAALLGVANAALGATVGVLQAERIADTVRGRILGLQNACLQVAAPAGIGVAGVVAQYWTPVAAAMAVFAIWVLVAVSVVLSRALSGLDRHDSRYATRELGGTSQS